MKRLYNEYNSKDGEQLNLIAVAKWDEFVLYQLYRPFAEHIHATFYLKNTYPIIFGKPGTQKI